MGLYYYDEYPFHIILYEGAQKERFGIGKQQIISSSKIWKEKIIKSAIIWISCRKFAVNCKKSSAAQNVCGQLFYFLWPFHYTRRNQLLCYGTVRENRMAKCPVKSTKEMVKMDRGAED